MERRKFVAALASSVVAVSGCLSSGSAGDGGPTDTPTQTPTDGSTEDPHTDPGTTTPTDTPHTDPGTDTGDGEFVSETFVVPEVVAPNSPDSFGVYGDRDEQYVVALVDGRDGVAPALEDVALVADGTSYEVTTELGYGGWSLFDYGEAYHPADNPRGWLVARVAKPLDAEQVRLTWPDGEYALGADLRADLARPPTTFEVKSFEAPETATVGDTVTATLTVENTGEHDGTFVAALNRSGPWIAYAPEAGVRLSVAAGETATWEFEHTLEADTLEDMDEERPMTLRLAWRDGDLNREVMVQPSEDGSGTDDAPTDGSGTDDTPEETPT